MDLKTGLPVNDQRSHFMRDIVIVTEPGATACVMCKYVKLWLRLIPICPSLPLTL